MRYLVLVLAMSGSGVVAAADDKLLALYRDLHAKPELSFQEARTAARIAGELQALGFAVTRGVGGHGVVGLLRNGEGPTVMIRTDMDALPVAEQTGLPYASRVTATDESGEQVPVMHACGHDVHMTAFIGTARELAASRADWRGTVMMVAQPAEERGAGARAMIADGLFERFARPDYNLALHVAANLPAGTVGYTPGHALAAVDTVDITVHGIGGHGAYPHTARDPVVLAAQIVLALQTLVSREVPPTEAAVVTVGSIHGGTKHNVIPDRVALQLTVRSYTDEVRRTLLDGIRRIAEGQARAAGLPESLLPEVRVKDESTPSTFNDPALTARVMAALARTLGEDAVHQVPPVMGGEDFAEYGRATPRIPSLLFWVGAVEPQRWRQAQRTGEPLPSLHSPFFAPAAGPTIDTAVRAMSMAARELLARP